MPSRAARTVLALIGSVLLSAGCAGGAASPAAERPPAPRLDEPSAGADPLAEPSRPGLARTAPRPPVADPGPLAEGSGIASPGGRDATLYVIGGQPLTTADLGDFILRYFPDRAREPLGQLVDEALVRHEAQREGVSVPEAAVRERAAAYLAERRREVRVQYGADMSLEELLERSFGRSFAAFERDAARLARIALVRDRLVRLDQRRAARVDVRALTFPDEEEARSGVERIRAGADLTLLARRLGLRPPAAPPPLARTDIHPEKRAEEVFAAEPGTVLEPRAFEAPDGRVWWEVVKVVGAWPADPRPWAEVSGDVEASIAARAVGVPEYLAWRRRALRRARVEVRRDGRGLVPWVEAEPSEE